MPKAKKRPSSTKISRATTVRRLAANRRQIALTRQRVKYIDKTKMTSPTVKEKQQKKKEALKLLEKSLQQLKDKFLKIPLKPHIKQRIDHILNHPRHADIRVCNKAFRVGPEGKSKLYTGLTKKLHGLFYPHYEEDPMKRSAEEVRRRKATNTQGKQKKACRSSGSAHGTKVHAQVQRFVKSFVKRKTKVNIPMSYDPCAIRVLNLFVSKQWIPIYSELAIYNEDWTVATSIDILVLDISDPSNPKIILGELKNGYESETYESISTDEFMRQPLANVRNCPMNRHVLQTIVMVMMLRRKYGIIVDDAVIIRSLARQRGIMIINMPLWALLTTVHTYIDKALSSNSSQ